MTSLLVVGECMMELVEQGQQSYSKSFAGDVYNSAVYAKRWCPELEVSILSAVGEDIVSEDMIKHWSQESIDTSLVLRTADANAGIYIVSTDEEGERSFSYWRRDSAATELMSLLKSSGGTGSIPTFDYLLFSGISLAIFDDADKASFLNMVQELRSRGTQVAFDPNYRPKMWRNREHARDWIERAYQYCDIAFPGLDDHKAIFGHQNEKEISQYLRQFDVNEMLIKCDTDGVYGYDKNKSCAHIPFTPAENLLDTTAAGDSFAGIYLALRMSDKTISESLATAAAVAGFVVQHKGAIVETEAFANFKRAYQLV